MQIRRFDLEPHNYAEPKSAVRVSADGQASGVGSAEGSRGERSAVRLDGQDSQLSGLVERFQSVSLVRAGAVEAAKTKLSQGEFGTRAAAEQLANSELKHQFFSNRP